MNDLLAVALHVGAALAAGSAIGLERTYHGRPAGFRTHALVCVASSVLMLVTVYAPRWFPGGCEAVQVDATRMAQGIMTGIGFLGAGVIYRAGLSVHGLTTAASIWITAAIGILAGIGLWVPGALATVVTLGVLSVFRYVEDLVPATRFARATIHFDRDAVMPEGELAGLLRQAGLSPSKLAYQVADGGRRFVYSMTLETVRPGAFADLSARLAANPAVREFEVAPY
jgi:putative Mg2+ transporter-C (MgtC) family protein